MTASLAWTLAFALLGLVALSHLVVLWYVRAARRRERDASPDGGRERPLRE